MGVTYHEFEQRTEEWKAVRLGTITGTGLKKIMGSKATEYVDDLVGQLLTGFEEAIYVNSAMQRGVDMEPIAKQYYTDKYGVEVKDYGFVTNSDYPGCGMSPDGFAGEEIGIEIKCPSSRVHVKTIRTNKLPSEYKWQIVMMFIICPHVKEVHFLSFDDRVTVKPLHRIIVTREELSVDIVDASIKLKMYSKKVKDLYKEISF